METAGSLNELYAVMQSRMDKAMQQLCDEMYISLKDYIQRDIYLEYAPIEYKRTGEFKESWDWDDESGSDKISKILRMHPEQMSLTLEESGWWTHANSRIKGVPYLVNDWKTKNGDDRQIMDLILNNFFGDDDTYHNPYWDDFRKYWTNKRIQSKFKEYLTKTCKNSPTSEVVR